MHLQPLQPAAVLCPSGVDGESTDTGHMLRKYQGEIAASYGDTRVTYIADKLMQLYI